MQTKVYWPIIIIHNVAAMPELYNRDIEKVPKGMNAAAAPDILAGQKDTTQ